MYNKIVWSVISVVSVAVALLVGWLVFQVGNNTPDVGPKPIKIGWIGPLTGEAAAYGQTMQSATVFAVSEINADGGINGHPLEVIFADGKCSGSGGESAAKKLIESDKVKIIIGGICNSETRSAIPVAERARVLMISAAASASDLSGVSPFFVRTYPPDDAQGYVLAEAAYGLKEWRKVAFIVEPLNYPLSVFDSFKLKFEELGGTVAKEEFSQTSDVRGIITKLKDENPDALFFSVQNLSEVEKIFSELEKLSLNLPMIVSDSFINSEFISLHPDLLEGALVAEVDVDESQSLFQLFTANYLKNYVGRSPLRTSYTPIIYDTVHMTAEALREVGNNPIGLANWFRSKNGWSGVSGNIEIDQKGDRVGGYVVKVIKDGQATVLNF